MLLMQCYAIDATFSACGPACQDMCHARTKIDSWGESHSAVVIEGPMSKGGNDVFRAGRYQQLTLLN